MPMARFSRSSRSRRSFASQAPRPALSRYLRPVGTRGGSGMLPTRAIAPRPGGGLFRTPFEGLRPVPGGRGPAGPFGARRGGGGYGGGGGRGPRAGGVRG